MNTYKITLDIFGDIEVRAQNEHEARTEAFLRYPTAYIVSIEQIEED